MSFIEIIPGFITQGVVPGQPVSVEKTETPESEIVEITTDDILDSSDEEINLDIKDIDLASHIIKNEPFVKTANIFESENLDKTNDTSDGNVSKSTSQGEVELQGLNEEFYSLSDLKVHEQLVLNCVNDLDDINMNRKPDFVETDFDTCYKTIETTLCEKDKQKIEVPYRWDKCHYKTNMHRNLKNHKIIHFKPEEIQYFCCYHCSYKSTRKYTLRRHIFQHFKNKEVTFHCYICDFMTLKRDLLIEHIKKHARVKLHKLSYKIQLEKYRCDKCNYNTFIRQSLNRHKITHLKPEEIQYFYCYHCSHKYKRRDRLVTHISRHFKNEDVTFHCYICDFMTLKRDLIIEHLKKHPQVKLHKLSYKIQTEKYRCDKCNYNTFIRESLNRHKITHLKPEESQYFYCYHCSHKSKNKYSLKLHIATHFNNENVPFHCYICDFMTLKRNLIVEHFKKHAQVKLHKLSYKLQPEKYRCDKCNYNTFRRQDFNRHKITHLKPEEIQYFCCYHCSYKYKRRDRLVSHISRHFKNEDVTFHCYICDFMTLKRDLIIEHLKKHAQVKLHTLSYKIQTDKYRCDKCNYNTFIRESLNRHKITHLKPEESQYFYCYHCSHKSKKKYSLKLHIATHFNNENVPFHCYICDFMTLKRNLIVEHFKKHAQIKLHKLSYKIQPEKYRCDKCNYNTFRRQCLNRHKTTHLKPEEIQYFYCYHCSHKSKRKDKLKCHISRHFKNKDVTFHCYICDFVTPKRDLIAQHIQKHSKVQIKSEITEES